MTPRVPEAVKRPLERVRRYLDNKTDEVKDQDIEALAWALEKLIEEEESVDDAVGQAGQDARGALPGAESDS